MSGLLVRVVRDGLDWRGVLSRRSGRAHTKGVVAHGQVGFDIVDGIHFSTADVFRGDCARFVHEGHLVVDALGDQVCAALAGGVEEIELLAPIAFSLRFEAVVAGWLSLIALEMALSACQTASTCSLRFVVCCAIACPFSCRQRFARRGVIVGRRRSSVCHSAALIAHREGSQMVAMQGDC